MIIKHAKYAPFILIAITIVVFFPTFFNDFQHEWDDSWTLLENPFVKDVSIESMVYHFKNFYSGQYSPVNTIFYIITYKIFGFEPTAYHAMSLLVHTASVLLLYRLMCSIISLVKHHYSTDRVKSFSFFVSLIFAIHPLQVEPIAWVSASKVILYAFFTLLACYAYVQ